MSVLGVPPKVQNVLQKYNPSKAEIDAFIDKEKEFIVALQRALIYDCCEMAASDGSFSATERRVVDDFARRLGVENNVSEQIQRIFDEEREAKKKRTALLFPHGVDTAIQSACDEKAKKVGRAS
jgi:hypothetical protein